MDNNKSNINDGQGEQQLRKRKFNESANDGQPATAGEKQKPVENLSKKKCEHQQGNDDLEFEQLSREDLIKLVRKSAKQAEEFSQRNVQLEQEKAEIHEDLCKKMAEIVDMHKEVKEKSEEVVEKTKQIDALLIQLKESASNQPQMPTEEQMIIQLSLETWFDMLAFVPRRQLGQIVPKIGHRKFASIAQKFLHEYGEIMVDEIEIVAPYAEDLNGPHPRVRAWQNCRQLTFELAGAQIPANIKNFNLFALRYFDQSVLNFMQKFPKNGLLDNVNLVFDKLLSKDIVQLVLCHLLPLINDIVSIAVRDSAQLGYFYAAGNSQEIYDMSMKMMEKTRLLGTSYDPENLHAKTIDIYCRWLYQAACADGKPRVLCLGRMDVQSAPISLFINRIKQDFLMATDPVTFFIRIILPKAFPPQEHYCLDNDKTKERLLTRLEETKFKKWKEVGLLISRYPHASKKKWIEENEKEVLNWDFCARNGRRIYLSKELKVIAI